MGIAGRKKETNEDKVWYFKYKKSDEVTLQIHKKWVPKINDNNVFFSGGYPLVYDK